MRVGVGVGGTLGIPLIVGGIEGVGVGKSATVKIFEGCEHSSLHSISSWVASQSAPAPLATISPLAFVIVQDISKSYEHAYELPQHVCG